MATMPFSGVSRVAPAARRDRAGWLSRAAGWMRRAHRRRRARLCIADFDDHLLRDVGITRAEAEQELNKPFWR